VRTLFDVALVLAVVASGIDTIEEKLVWQSQISTLVSALAAA
jgi:hypothetical protein